MTNSMQIPLLILISLFLSWRLSRTTADADWAMFNLAGFTGSWYGRDFIDCKTPGIHLYYWMIAKIVGADVARVKFMDHMLTSLPGIIYTVITGEFIPGLVFITLINAPHLHAFTGNVGHLATALIMAALIPTNPWLSSALLLAAIFVEPKYLPAGIGTIYLSGWWQAGPTLAAGLVAAYGILGVITIITKINIKDLIGWIIEGSVTIPGRMSKTRPQLAKWMPWWTAECLVFILPWIGAAAWARPNPEFWIPPILYMAVTAIGLTLRPYHLMPLIPYIAAAGIEPGIAYALAAFQFATAGFYLGDIWTRHYRAYADIVQAGKQVGEWINGKMKEGVIKEQAKLWVNGMHTQIYIYARKKVLFGLAEQIEINTVAKERRGVMRHEWKKNPPDWVAQCADNHVVQFTPNGYKLIAEAPGIALYQKVI